MQSDSDSEVEDLINPKDELKKKIVDVAYTIRNWHDETVKARKSVRDQLQEIVDLGLNTYKMEKDGLRILTEEIFRYHGISESWLRKLLPRELKDTSKTRLSYLHKQEIEIEKERQHLLREHPEFQQRSEIKVSQPVEEPRTYQPSSRQESESQEYENYHIHSHETNALTEDKLEITNKKR